MSQTTWVLIANGSRATVYEAASPKELMEVGSFEHNESKAAGKNLVTDRPGRVTDSVGGGRHAMEDGTPPKEVELKKFAHDLALFLDENRRQNAFQRLYIAAIPRFLGLLQNELSKHVTELIVESIDKDLTAVPARELGDRLDLRMPL